MAYRGNMSGIRRRNAGFLVAQVVSIFLGVLVALGADRWVSGLDDRALRDSYMASLQSDLRHDSLHFALGERFGHDNIRHVGLLLPILREGTWRTTDRKDVLVALEMLSDWIPRKYAAGTWTDLLATGNLRLIDRDLRRRLSAYYDARPDQVESNKNMEPFRRYDSVVSGLLSPEQRMMALWSRFGSDPDTASSIWESELVPDPGLEVSTATTLSDREFEALIDRLAATPGLEAMLGDILWRSLNLSVGYTLLHTDVSKLLADPLFAGAAP